MKMQTALIIIAVISFSAFFFVAPVQPAESGCPQIILPGGVNCSVHYAKSFSCEFVGIGDYYWNGALWFGCELVLP